MKSTPPRRGANDPAKQETRPQNQSPHFHLISKKKKAQFSCISAASLVVTRYQAAKEARPPYHTP
jgi:hypothetical protein